MNRLRHRLWPGPAWGAVRALATITILLVPSNAHAQDVGAAFSAYTAPALDAFADLDAEAYMKCMESEDPTHCEDSISLPDTSSEDPSDEDEGILDFVELQGSSGITANVHFTHQEYIDCLNGSEEDCSSLYVTRISLPAANGEEASEALDEAWEVFVDRMIDTLHEKLNEGPPCVINSPVCTLFFLGVPPAPSPDIACIASRLATAYPAALAEHYPQYWNDVFEAIATNLPNSVAYGLEMTTEAPLGGSIVSPLHEPLDPGPLLARLGLPADITTITASMVAGLGDDARAQLYYQQVPLRRMGINVPMITLPDENTFRTAGIDAFEDYKATHFTDPAGAQAYQDSGYAHLWQAHAPMTSFFFGRSDLLSSDFPLWYKPSVEVECAEGFFSIPGLLFPVPVPAYLPKTISQPIVVPEGGHIPRSGGSIDAFPESFGF